MHPRMQSPFHFSDLPSSTLEQERNTPYIHTAFDLCSFLIFSVFQFFEFLSFVNLKRFFLKCKGFREEFCVKCEKSEESDEC